MFIYFLLYNTNLYNQEVVKSNKLIILLITTCKKLVFTYVTQSNAS